MPTIDKTQGRAMGAKLPKGAIVQMREQGHWHTWMITNANTTWHTGVCWDTIPAGTMIHRCVWKDGGTRLEVRSTFVKIEDATLTKEQWEAEQKARYDAHCAAMDAQKKAFDALVANLPDNPDAVIAALMPELLNRKL